MDAQRAAVEQFCAEAIIAWIAVEYLELFVRELVMDRPHGEIAEAIKRRLHASSPEQRPKVGEVYLRYCAPTRCAA